MPKFSVTAPDGSVYEVNAPEGSTHDDAIKYVQNNLHKPKKGGFLQGAAQQGKNALGGAIRGAGSIGATLLAPYDYGMDYIKGDRGKNLSSLITGKELPSRNAERRAAMDEALGSMGADTDSWMYKGGKLAGEVAGTAGAGGVVANTAGRALPFLARVAPSAASKAAPVLQAISSGGMSVGGLTGKTAIATRAAGGAVSGAVQAGLVNPNDAGTGALIGAAMPGAFQLAGKAGQAAYRGIKGVMPNQGKALADALGVSADDLPRIIAAARNAPDELVPGSRLTLNQAIQQQGMNEPSLKMLERIVSGGPGGDELLKRYAQQGTARMAALEANGAQVYQGAAAEEAMRAGDKIGAILRTQAADDRQAARTAWEMLHGKATQEGVALQLPLDDMQAAMRPLGRGSVVAGADARRVLSTADEIGNMVLPALDELPKDAARNSQTLEKAVRAMGGIKAGNSGMRGELGDLGIKNSGTTGLVNNKSGKSADMVADEMFRRGFIPDNDPATLMDALRNGGGRKLFADDQVAGNTMQRMGEAAQGDMPGAEKIIQAVPFEEFQRLRRDSGSLAAKAAERAGGETEASVLARFQELLTARADDAANGNLLSGENMTPEFMADYNAARALTRRNAEAYKGGGNIAQILRKPSGQDFTLTGSEIRNKLWHGGSGLAGDVNNLKQVLNSNNYTPTMDALRRSIMTDAAGMTTASGDLAAGLPRYVENRMPGLAAALNDDQFRAITGVASDIRNAAAANNVAGLLGSDTYAKTARAMDGGLLDAPLAKTAAGLLSFKGLGADSVRRMASDAVISHKGKTMARLLLEPKLAADALENAGFVSRLTSEQISRLQAAASRVQVGASRSVPQLAAD